MFDTWANGNQLRRVGNIFLPVFETVFETEEEKKMRRGGS